MRDAGAVIHSHGIESCLATMINPSAKEFRVSFHFLAFIHKGECCVCLIPQNFQFMSTFVQIYLYSFNLDEGYLMMNCLLYELFLALWTK